MLLAHLLRQGPPAVLSSLKVAGNEVLLSHAIKEKWVVHCNGCLMWVCYPEVELKVWHEVLPQQEVDDVEVRISAK